MKKIILFVIVAFMATSCGREKMIISDHNEVESLIIRKCRHFDEYHAVYICTNQNYHTEWNMAETNPAFIAKKGLYTVGDTVRIEFKTRK